jgi:hypothetical protein
VTPQTNYLLGGYYTGFKQELLQANNFTNLGFPIAEIEADGGVVITKEENAGGILTVQTVTAQLLYEIQGPLYYNSDVTARLNNIKLTQEGPHRVRVAGVEGLPPPPTTKGTSRHNNTTSPILICLSSRNYCERWLAGRISFLPNRTRYRGESENDRTAN